MLVKERSENEAEAVFVLEEVTVFVNDCKDADAVELFVSVEVTVDVSD